MCQRATCCFVDNNTNLGIDLALFKKNDSLTLHFHLKIRSSTYLIAPPFIKTGNNCAASPPTLKITIQIYLL
jgi:hypothetical protein